MPRKEPKSEIVAFKVEKELAEFLNKLPNKSEFIRKAIVAQFGMACPLCIGTGVVPRGVHTHYKTRIADQNERPCDRCGKKQSFPLNIESLETYSEDDRERLEQFLHGGPLYCAACYPKVPECDDCGWHIPHEEVADHIRKVHS
jgi:hypothetical protein